MVMNSITFFAHHRILFALGFVADFSEYWRYPLREQAARFVTAGQKRSNTMKSMKQLAAIAIFGALTCAGLRAQTVDLRATIPFDFNIGQTSMPAGDYEIQGHGMVVLVRRVDTGKPANAFVVTIGAESANRDGTPRLSFHHYGDEYFLSAIWDPSGGRLVRQTGRELEMAKRAGAAVEATVIATNKR